MARGILYVLGLSLGLGCGSLTGSNGLVDDEGVRRCYPEGDPCPEPNHCWGRLCCPPDEPSDDGGAWSDGGGDGDGDTDGCGTFLCVDELTPSCDPGIQDCPERQKCTSYVRTPGYCCVDATKCMPLIGNKDLGEACVRTEENDDCDRGLFCMTKTSGDIGQGVCLAYCNVSDPGSCEEAGVPDGDCIPGSDGVLPLCQAPCDPLAQDCPGGQGCYAAGVPGFVCTLPGHEPGKGQDGDACYTIQSCEPGNLCANGEASVGCDDEACCTPFCECDPERPEGIDSPTCTTEGEQCLCYYLGNGPPQYERVGLCARPE